ncbi:BCSC C-terminal domain-containing protein [Cupriavidus pinatubonensis]|uniref:cellulose synthase subunit BcsC-related outer membrane protein n=1 Tax=Cupriavidus pinatubonensis TaxID=248026 RepID=UPI001C72E651|nr:cellulose synthase subunit BcsC-related outer membrane protein [Cupriavidus pinatubonensis]QYY29333.1 BCSC C-terminal domain-containing protein [Cupriavidus pinatubonensis]
MSRALTPLVLAVVSALAVPAMAQQAEKPSPEMTQLLAAARMWEAKNRTDIARGILDKALLIDPNQPDALMLLGLIEIRSNRPLEADKILRTLRQRAPNHPATLELEDAYRIATRDKQEMARIRLLARAGKSEEAIARLRQLFPRGAPRGELAVDYYRIMAGTPAGRTASIAELRARVRQDPDDLRLAMALASLLTDREATRQEGLGILYRIVQRPDGDRKSALEMWRRTLYGVSDDPAYFKWFELYVKEVPDDTSARQTLAELAKKGGAASPASQARRRGEQQLARGNVREAETALESANRKRRNDGETLGNLGLVRLRQGRHDEARELFARAEQLDSGNRGKWHSLKDTARFWGTVAKAREANAQGKPAQGEALAREALALQPGNANARGVLADALIAQNKLPEAEALLRETLAGPEPDIGTLRTLVKLLNDSQRSDEVGPLIASTGSRLKGSADELRSLRADLLSLQGEQLLAQRKQSPALARLEESIRLAPNDPWTRFTLARAYRDLALPALGRRVMEDGLAASPTSEMRYAIALYLNSVDDIDAASSVLAGVPEAERSDSMRRLAGNLQAQRLLREARQLVAAGREQEAEDKLRAAADAARDDPQMLASVGREWIAIGQPDTGLRLVRDWLDAHPQDPAIDVRIRYGELLASAERDDELRTWIAESSALPGITPEQRADFDDQLLRLALRDTDRRVADGDLKGAERMLYAVPAAQQNDRRWLLELADLREAQGDYDGAAQAAREVLTTHPQDADARLTVARMLERQGKDDQALEEVRAVLADTPGDDIDTRLAVARRFTAMRREDEALAVVTPLRERYPERSDVTMQAGRIAQSRGNFNGAALLYREARVQEQRENEIPGPQGTSAERALGALEARREGQVSTAVLFSNKSGDPGISRLNATEIPLYVRIPNGYTGHAFFHADTVLLDAGTLPADSLPGSRDFGKIRALGNNGLGPISQSDRGVALAAGYEFNGAYNSWRADIGTTPLGFTLQTVVGGFRYRAEMGPASATVDISRRAVTSSLVSYAGATDPRHVDPQTGAVTPAESWGNVVRNGIHARYARDVGRFGLFADLGYGVYTGTNVLTNQEFTVRTGFDVPVFVRRDQRITSGVVLNYWRYAENERFYTFGHGGYYSPQKYLSFLIPLDWTGRRGLLSWRLRGSVGMSSTYEKSMDIYPTRPDLQAMVGGAQYEGGSGGGFSYTVGGIVEYRFAPHWVAGAGFDIDRSRDYAPNRAFAYLRYFFERQQGAVPYPPTPVRPYSTY